MLTLTPSLEKIERMLQWLKGRPSTRRLDEIQSYLQRHGITWQKEKDYVFYQDRRIGVISWTLCRRDGSKIEGGLRAALEELKQNAEKTE